MQEFQENCIFFAFFYVSICIFRKKALPLQPKTTHHHMFNTKISVFTPPQFGYYVPGTTQFVKAAKEPTTHTLGWVADYIRTQAEQATTALRNAGTGDVTVKRKQKIGERFVDYDKTMPQRKFVKQTQFAFALFGGEFAGGHKAKDMKTPSQLFVVDFDGHDNPGVDMTQARERLLHDEQVQPLMLFVSPSGDGLKMVVQVPFNGDIEQWRERLHAVWQYLKTTHGLNADTSNNDICRGCYLPHDANIYCNPDARTVLDFDTWAAKWKQENPQPQRREQQRTFNREPLAGDAERAMWYAEQLMLKHADITGKQPDWARLGFAIAELGEQGREIFHIVSRAGFVEYDFDETEQLFDCCMVTRTGAVGLATFIEAAKTAIGTTYEQEHKTQNMKDNTMSAKTQQFEPQPPQQQQVDENRQPAPEQAANPHKLRDADNNALLDYLMHAPTLDELTTMIGRVPPAIPTQYTFGIEPEIEPLTLPRQALTIIAAQTSGGKTRMLQNIALQVAKYEDKDTTGTTLFFSLEEPAADIICEMANIHHNEQLECGGKPGKNVDILKRAMRCQHMKKQTPDTSDTTPWECFADAQTWQNETQRTQQELDIATGVVAGFEKEYLQPRGEQGQPRMRIYGDEDFTNVELICRALRLFPTGSIKAVFIDYLGMFRAPAKDARLPKTERIENMLDALEWVAKELQLPVVISAQLKRENNATPWTLRNSSVADSADIERSCNTMILLWNSREHCDVTGNEAMALSNAGFVIDRGGKLFARMTKRRGGIRNCAVVLNFSENTGKITMGTGCALNATTPAPEPMTPAELEQGNNAPGFAAASTPTTKKDTNPGTENDTTDLPF